MERKAQTDCIFCKIISGEIPSRTVYEDDAYKAIMDVSPASRGHVIILPKTHVANIYEIPDDVAAGIMVVAKKIALAVKEAFGCDGVNILQNNEVAAGQTVFHFHVHVIPRYADDTVNIKWEQLDDVDIDAACREIKKITHYY
ncbi:MAG: HIT family protein [Lachnospiraceae bacterium]|nr:HIT family protein [Lachnospiraceae bacterium]